jgi:hypothetical protein
MYTIIYLIANDEFITEVLFSALEAQNRYYNLKIQPEIVAIALPVKKTLYN